MRLTGYSFLFLLFISTFCSADLKIKTRTTVMGHSTESTVYIKGSRERTEMSFGGHGGSVTLLQCDQKRMVSVMGDQCTVTPFGGNETSCPAAPDMRGMGKDMDGRRSGTSHKGGVVTISRTSTDTGERQEMFGYKARHIKSTMMMESTPDACNQSNMKMEIDGWYADLANFSCGEESYRAMACGGMGGKRGCQDRIVMKGGGAPYGLPAEADDDDDHAAGNLHYHDRSDRADEDQPRRVLCSTHLQVARWQTHLNGSHDSLGSAELIRCCRSSPGCRTLSLLLHPRQALRPKPLGCCA